jgi:hypothetical protein
MSDGGVVEGRSKVESVEKQSSQTECPNNHEGERERERGREEKGEGPFLLTAAFGWQTYARCSPACLVHEERPTTIHNNNNYTPGRDGLQQVSPHVPLP